MIFILPNLPRYLQCTIYSWRDLVCTPCCVTYVLVLDELSPPSLIYFSLFGLEYGLTDSYLLIVFPETIIL